MNWKTREKQGDSRRAQEAKEKGKKKNEMGSSQCSWYLI
jgi:hypothetical protein